MQEYFLFTFSSYLIHHEMKQMHPKTMRLDQHKVALLDKYLTIFLRLMEAHCRNTKLNALTTGPEEQEHLAWVG